MNRAHFIRDSAFERHFSIQMDNNNNTNKKEKKRNEFRNNNPSKQHRPNCRCTFVRIKKKRRSCKLSNFAQINCACSEKAQTPL